MNQRRGNGDWIIPHLERLKLASERKTDPGKEIFWSQVENFELTERVGKLVTEVNRRVGYHLLRMVDYLPQQKDILRVSFEERQVKHSMEISIQEPGIVLMFSSKKLSRSILSRFFSSNPEEVRSTVVWEQVIRPQEILDQNIQGWLSYLLSGLDKRFRLDQILQASLENEARFEAGIQKLSA